MPACSECGGAVPIRWRNPGGRPQIPCRLHVAGPVISCREYRRSCPEYIVDRRQCCADCGRQLVRGRWAVFFLEGAEVVEILDARAPAFNYHRDDAAHPRCA